MWADDHSAFNCSRNTLGENPTRRRNSREKFVGSENPQYVGHFIDGHAGVGQQALGLQQLAVVHDLQGRLPAQFAAGAVEVRHRDPQLVRQVFDLRVFAVVLLSTNWVKRRKYSRLRGTRVWQRWMAWRLIHTSSTLTRACIIMSRAGKLSLYSSCNRANRLLR
jgi:hypothetical protein